MVRIPHENERTITRGQLRRREAGWEGRLWETREVLHWDQWIRRRVRLCHWKDWKRPGTRRKRLLELGADPKKVHLVTRSRKGYWRLASNRIVQQALDYPYLKSLGLPSLKGLWIAFKYGSQATA